MQNMSSEQNATNLSNKFPPPLMKQKAFSSDTKIQTQMEQKENKENKEITKETPLVYASVSLLFDRSN